MAIGPQLPCDGDDVCMRCKTKPPTEECLTCATCVTPWHVDCLSSPPQSLASTTQWTCPDCSGDSDLVPVTGNPGIGSDESGIVAAIRAIEADVTLTESQKAKKRQQLMSGKADVEVEEEKKNGVVASLDENFICSICKGMLKRPVSTPCGHNFCLECFNEWVVKKKKYNCPSCRTKFTKTFAENIKINLTLVSAIRLSNVPETAAVAAPKHYHFISIKNDHLPDKAYRTARAKKTGIANAASGKRFVTTPRDHFGPIPAENDPKNNRGVLVGDSWSDRQACKQWGAHNPHISGIAGQSKHGAQSVAVAGGYKDDVDHGEYILYTGSGGRDLSRNRRTNDKQSSDQTFAKANEALRLSCQMGYPVRVVRSDKEKTAYAPKKGVRYDGVYRVEKCWRTVGEQGTFKVCRYLLVRCDNEPAPWTSDEHGDRPRPLPDIPELEKAIDLYERKESPSWDFDEADGRWKWVKAPPASKLAMNPEGRKNMRKSKGADNSTIRDKLLKGFNCTICKNVMSLPVTTPCAHNFCKACLESTFAGVTQIRERSRGGRTLRSQKNIMKCPSCTTDICDFLQNPQVDNKISSSCIVYGEQRTDGSDREAEEERRGDCSTNGRKL
ncbi:unnamed protein product [Arabis nemorensis]|uniref:RING-type E3 ubiquitin transferase n=1 Tax=Arabis nemorensis TaxID=586526 RepID=A0A565BG04_9BRAS|nr:unnamed protein product [Arabis nemorensis]